MAKGYIYIMTNPCLHDMVKIGYATDVEERRKQLSTTALPTDYEIYATYETPGKLEDKKLHKLIDNLNPDLRVSKNREFFIMAPDDAYSLLDAIATISGTREKLQKATDKESNTNQGSQKTGAIQKSLRPAINFTKCNIPIGAQLIYVEDPNVTVTVVSDRKVQYNDEITSLSALACRLKGWKAAQGPHFFTYNGKTICEIAEETQWKGW
jgi:hypothetical protein